MDIYGSIEDENYWNKCSDYIDKNNLNIKYIKKLNPQEVQNTLNIYHFLFFPTHHENYGHVIVEALSSGCGLILSTNTPWRHLDRNKIGWDINLNKPEKFVEVIDHCYQMKQEEYDSYRKNCYQYVKNETTKIDAIELTGKMFSA